MLSAFSCRLKTGAPQAKLTQNTSRLILPGSSRSSRGKALSGATAGHSSAALRCLHAAANPETQARRNILPVPGLQHDWRGKSCCFDRWRMTVIGEGDCRSGCCCCFCHSWLDNLAAAAAFSAVGVSVRILLTVPSSGASTDAIVTPYSPYEVGCRSRDAEYA